MAFSKQASIPGLNRTFQVSPEARPYTLRDNGFVNTKPGNFLYERTLETAAGAKVVLKVTVNKNLETLKISTVTPNGLNSVNVNNLADNSMVLEKIHFIFDGFVDRDCLIEVTD
ncbi:cysteine desulfurase [Aerococcaceae bacterium DSM 111020]|nr:cysteine desulfurase [Aerococcaceae bacterium DSM 111020]